MSCPDCEVAIKEVGDNVYPFHIGGDGLVEVQGCQLHVAMVRLAINDYIRKIKSL